MKKPLSRWASSLAASALMLGGVTVVTGGGVAQAAQGECVASTGTVTVFGFNDYHGRIAPEFPSEIPKAALLFTPVEEARALDGTGNVLLLSSGDNIGGSTFVSAVGQDKPTLDVLEAAGVDVIAAGNHEFDRGWADLSERVIPGATMPYLGANVYDKGTTNVADPLEEYALFDRGGVTIGVIGAVTGDLPSLVSPAGITEIEAGDPVDAVNRVAAQLSDGDDTNGEADIIIASIHEGAPDGSMTKEENAAASAAFADIHNNLDASVDAVFNGHTHQVYSWTTSTGKPLLSAGQYGSHLAKLTLDVDAINGELCSATGSTMETPAVVGDSARITEIENIVAEAVATADVLGQEPVGFANQAISTPGAGKTDTRDVESPISNLVAQMFKEQLSDDDPDFIGVQNPGGNRASFDRGTVTYMEAANVLPFANSLFTTQLTGKQFKTVLEQQWQLNSSGAVPSRPYLALGLSDNVSYTFDESRDRLDRITSISIDGEPIHMDKLYTMGSGSFLISGGDNFFEFRDGVNTKDSGNVDLETWVDWIKEQDALSPDYTKRGVSAPQVVGSLTEGAAPVEYVFGKPLEGGVQPDTLDMLLNETGDRVSPQLMNDTVVAYIGDEMVGMGEVTDGVGTVQVAIANGTDIQAGNNTIDFLVEDSGTVISLPVTVKLVADVPARPVDLYTTPGYHKVNGREWITSCEPYSITERCRTYIYGTDVQNINGKIVKRNGWMFNNLTYKPSPRSAWKNNPLGYAGSWTSTEGRKWMTECDTAKTGKNACRSYIQTRVVESVKQPNGSYNYKMNTKFVFNNIVQFT